MDSIPDASLLGARRHTVNSHLLSVDEILTSSLPSPILQAEFTKLKERSHRSLERSIENDLVEDIEKEGFFRRSFSTKATTPKFQRPRSASMQNQHLNSPSLKKSLRTLSRSRPSSARFSSRKGSTQQSSEQEANAGTRQVDMAFAKIKSQLDELSAEDTILQERLDHLSAEIAYINRYAAKLRLSCSMEGGKNIATQEGEILDDVFPSPTLMVSSAQNDTISTLSEESWEEDEIGKKLGNGLVLSPKCFNMRGNPKGVHGNGSLGSCGSLADSEGSVSPVTRVPCCIVVVDHDQNVKISREARFYEDDVFLS